MTVAICCPPPPPVSKLLSREMLEVSESIGLQAFTRAVVERYVDLITLVT